MNEDTVEKALMHLAKAMDLLETKSEKIILLSIEVERLKIQVKELSDYIEELEP